MTPWTQRFRVLNRQLARGEITRAEHRNELIALRRDEAETDRLNAEAAADNEYFWREHDEDDEGYEPPPQRPADDDMARGRKKDHSADLRVRFATWQSDGVMQPLTCAGGGGPCHGVKLELADATDDCVMARCPTCQRVQSFPVTTNLGDMIARYPLGGPGGKNRARHIHEFV